MLTGDRADCEQNRICTRRVRTDHLCRLPDKENTPVTSVQHCHDYPGPVQVAGRNYDTNMKV